MQQQMNMEQMMTQPMPEDMIGAIKIKDGLFIGDSFAAQVSYILSPNYF
jgi:hypothetical protein